jgi:hypothetical protein
MKRLTTAYSFLVLTAMPAVAMANPNTESPEPSFWLFVALGTLPLAFLGWKQYRQRAVAVESH